MKDSKEKTLQDLKKEARRVRVNEKKILKDEAADKLKKSNVRKKMRKTIAAQNNLR